MDFEGFTIKESSVREKDGRKYAMVKDAMGWQFLYIEGEPVSEFSGCKRTADGCLYPLSYPNAVALYTVFDFLRPVSFGLKGPSFGFGDRLGLATAGHIRSLAGKDVMPVLAQQSIREMKRTKRRPEDVIASAVFGAFSEGFTTGFGSDADHLRRLKDVDYVLPYRYSMFTCDPSNYVNNRASTMGKDELKKAFSSISEHPAILSRYAGKMFKVKGGSFEFSELDVMRAAVKYYNAVKFAATMFEKIYASVDYRFDYEVSVDETDTPTTYKEHIFIVNELKRFSVEFTAIAPRFIGEFYKGMDYVGDLKEFEESIKIHKGIVDEFGPYKISIHSGSDKLKIYPILGEHLGRLLHIKTAGTSYLEALRVIAKKEASLFVRIYDFSLQRFDEDKKSYHISVRKENLPRLKEESEEFERLLDDDDIRQMLHVTYGSVLTSDIGRELLLAIQKHEEEYANTLERHFKNHLSRFLGGSGDE